jgi:hypothetical protein
MRIAKITCFALAAAAATFWAIHLWRVRCDVSIVDALQAGDFKKARVLLDGYHDWKSITRRIDSRGLPRLWQAALDVQFEHRYIPDSNYPYPENVPLVKTLIAKGARPTFSHLLAATEQGKMQTARLLLDHGVPATAANAEGDPLSNVAYFGDCRLIEDLIERGADVNHGTARGWRPLLAAAWSDRHEAVALLLKHGADPTLPYSAYEGQTEPIWITIRDRASRGPDADRVWQLVKASLEHRGNSEPHGAANARQPIRPGTN